jgi:circadian clock protein KaiC
MSNKDKVMIRRMPTGVVGLDEITGGGLSEYSFNIIAGSPGCGKTTLAHQIMFANASEERPALYFTVLGEPAIKMLRYQQQYPFFDHTKIGTAVRVINLTDVTLTGNLQAVLDRIIAEVESMNPSIVIVDSFRTVLRQSSATPGEMDQQAFLQRLAIHLTSWEATTFLIGEYNESELRDNPVFTVADGLIWLYQQTDRDSIVRKLQVIKMRGQATVPGLHTFRITSNGIQAFSRTLGLLTRREALPNATRLSLGVPEIDLLMGGGAFEGDSILVAGPSGAGKSILAKQFVAEGIRRGESAVVAVFEERPRQYGDLAGRVGLDLDSPQHEDRLRILYLRPLDLSVDETLIEILEAVREIGAKRLVIDSLAGFEMALAPGFRTDFRESLYRMIGALTGVGVTILSTVEVAESFTDLPFSNYSISFLTDDIIRLRYVEIEGRLRKVLFVVKVRGGEHSNEIVEYKITSSGLELLDSNLSDYKDLITGTPTRVRD